MNGIVLAVVVTVLALLPIIIVASYVMWFKRKYRAEWRASISKKMMRAPGHTLSKQLEDMGDDLDATLAAFMALPALLGLIYFLQVHYEIVPDNWFVRGGALLGFTIWLSFQARSISHTVKKRRRFMLARDAEMAIGQELNMLMRDGAWVCHDFPGENFNIDHIVVLPQGVLAVETKSRRKAKNGGRDAARVKFDGKVLQFPTHAETKPIVQAISQAEWLAKWLTSATGDKVQVLPVLALPGWYVERSGNSSSLQITNGAELRYLLKAFRNAAEMRADQFQRVVHQLEQRCRDVEPYMSGKS